jgi:hypothetical protein
LLTEIRKTKNPRQIRLLTEEAAALSEEVAAERRRRASTPSPAEPDRASDPGSQSDV